MASNLTINRKDLHLVKAVKHRPALLALIKALVTLAGKSTAPIASMATTVLLATKLVGVIAPLWEKLLAISAERNVALTACWVIGSFVMCAQQSILRELS